jgi:hypothetical protein
VWYNKITGGTSLQHLFVEFLDRDRGGLAFIDAEVTKNAFILILLLDSYPPILYFEDIDGADSNTLPALFRAQTFVFIDFGPDKYSHKNLLFYCPLVDLVQLPFLQQWVGIVWKKHRRDSLSIDLSLVQLSMESSHMIQIQTALLRFLFGITGRIFARNPPKDKHIEKRVSS